MAVIKVNLPTDLQRQLEQAGREMDNIAESALRAGADVLFKASRARLQQSLAMPRKYPKRGTGELQSALGISPVHKTEGGGYDIKVGFREPRNKQPGKRIGRSTKGGGYYVATNAMVGNILEHGHKGSNGGQAPAPWLAPAVQQAQKAAEEAVCKTVEKRLDEIFKDK